MQGGCDTISAIAASDQ